MKVGGSIKSRSRYMTFSTMSALYIIQTSELNSVVRESTVATSIRMNDTCIPSRLLLDIRIRCLFLRFGRYCNFSRVLQAVRPSDAQAS